MKFDNEHDEYVFTEIGLGSVNGHVDAPTGRFAEIELTPGAGAEEDAAIEHYGTVHLILQEGADGNTYVHPFPDRAALNVRLLLLEREWRLWETGVADDDLAAMHLGFMRAMAGAIGMPRIATEWSPAAQAEARCIVADWLVDNHDDVVKYMTLPYARTYGREYATWEDVGTDLAHVMQRQGFAFTDAVGAHECAAEMNRTAQHVPPLALIVVDGVIEVES